MKNIVEETVGGVTMSIESGEVATQADGSVIVRYGDTVVLSTAVCGDPKGGDFLPMTVDYREKTYSVGKFPGGFFKRESRPSNKEILTMRMTDRPMRPLFPKGYTNEVQVMSVVLSADKETDPDVISMVGASAAVSLSGMPFNGPTGSVRVGLINDEFVINPKNSELATSSINLVVSGTEDAVMMVESSGKEVSEDKFVDAILFGFEEIKKIVRMQKELVAKCGKERQVHEEPTVDSALYDDLKAKIFEEIKVQSVVKGKLARKKALKELRGKLIEEYCTDADEADKEGKVKEVFGLLVEHAVQEQIINDKKRLDGRGLTDIRPITGTASFLPRTHGSALFTRGETQALVVATLGTSMDEQRVDGLVDGYAKKFMLDYNFPPFCVGEAKPIRGPGRREIGHGTLAEKALEPMVPAFEDFPYTIRIVSDILESNGSSSMASVCGGTLCMMDAGVPMKRPVAGIAMGMIKEGEEVRILSDILGDEDHLGAMDFKVAGTEVGITALQMDLKITGISEQIMRDALAQAKEGRMHILKEMQSIIEKPRSEISIHAPKLVKIKINPDKIGLVIGPGGKNIKKIQEESSSRVEIEEDGTIVISAATFESVELAKTYIRGLTDDAEVGKIYNGKIVSVKEYGVFVEIMPGKEGLVHISELSNDYIEKVEDVVKMGDEVKVKLIGIDDQKRLKLSRKAALTDEKAAQAST
ncbi:MAG: polyribonucleotide nucleotidyltransferase [Candidatus Scalindua sp.]|nr:polyribonucleotide nucleotidyltransferase [Candidatus Scalindua sp.]MBT5304446.1 polyribonucleotide nucleotidyltransferase [Candidatus Scalindua sp.]MBT6047923.1 polyribonucleotide nucleotidyltransferase [Candidatus Scalindua sp.]MBT6562996.1 polyribonucleotide nucleotidyltransferase [Candidatus Scalindua sp.]MBT7210019.1 polyribonucleotide nucleotidyltransferase [Candidatus Scalindua sp.]